jgi:uncharacterized protein YabN with tetrapyrrole methylase and pyrophosphatase domain
MSTVDIYLLGAGIHSSLHFSVETIQALSSSRVVFVLHDDLSVHDCIRNYCKDVRDLAELYKGRNVRADVYRDISELLVKEAVKEPGVAFVVHGHPLFLVSAAEYTLDLARSQGLRVSILPAISSFDTILCALEIDYGYGLQIFDATTLIQKGWSPNPAIPMLLFQLATTLNEKVAFDEPPSSVLTPLVEYLLKTYPGEHTCTIVHSASHLLEKSSKVILQLAELSKAHEIELWKRPTLYVPPIY